MPTRIFKGVLRGLENIFKFPDAQRSAPGEMELDLPVQPVMDVSDIAKWGSGVGGYEGLFVGSFEHTHAAVGSITSTPDFWNPTASLGQFPAGDALDPNLFQMWMLDGWMGINDGNDFQNGYVGYFLPADIRGPVAQLGAASVLRMLRYWSIPVGPYAISDFDAIPVPELPFPLLKDRRTPGALAGGYFSYSTTSKNAGTVECTCNILLWLGALSQSPPGR